jgi:hypothetical protein
MLCVQIFLDIERPLHDVSSPYELVRAFAQRFVQNGPGKRLPKLYYHHQVGGNSSPAGPSFFARLRPFSRRAPRRDCAKCHKSAKFTPGRTADRANAAVAAVDGKETCGKEAGMGYP